MQIFNKIDIGNKRNTNQDAYSICELPDGALLAVVCDGMGGVNGGDIASRTATDIICEYVKNSYNSAQGSDRVFELLKNGYEFETYDKDNSGYKHLLVKK